MTRQGTWRKLVWVGSLGSVALLCVLPTAWAVEPTAAANAAFDRYSAMVEARLRQGHETSSALLVLPRQGTDEELRLRQGELLLEKLTPAAEANPPGAMLHDWRGTAFLPGGRAAEFERVLHDFSRYPQRFAPQVTGAQVVGGQGDDLQAWMRVQQKHGITVTLDATYDVRFGRLDLRRGFSFSRSTRIEEIDQAGTLAERALTQEEEHGFLWRLNTYWSWEERDGGLYVQVESISLTRAIPTGLGWVIGPFVQSVPRESLQFTLHAACAALRKP